MPKINLKAKTDRELLIMVVQASNTISERLDQVNGLLSNHEHRLTVVETADKLRWKLGSGVNTPGAAIISPSRLLLVIGSTVFVLGSGLAGIIYGIGKVLGQW